MFPECPHVSILKINPQNEAVKYEEACCATCDFQGASLWLCLQEDCEFVGCSENVKDHSSVHSQESRHPLSMNLQTKRIWCNECECEAFYKKANERPSKHRYFSLFLCLFDK